MALLLSFLVSVSDTAASDGACRRLRALQNLTMVLNIGIHAGRLHRCHFCSPHWQSSTNTQVRLPQHHNSPCSTLQLTFFHDHSCASHIRVF